VNGHRCAMGMGGGCAMMIVKVQGMFTGGG